jgi:hypothetical protein
LCTSFNLTWTMPGKKVVGCLCAFFVRRFMSDRKVFI